MIRSLEKNKSDPYCWFAKKKSSNEDKTKAVHSGGSGGTVSTPPEIFKIMSFS